MSNIRSGFFRRIRLRMRLAWLFENAQVYAPYLGLLVVLLFTIDWLTSRDEALIGSLIALVAYCLFLMVGALTIRITPWDTSRSAERGLGVRSVLTTALEFDEPENEIHMAIQRQADAIAGSASPARAIPMFVRTDRMRWFGYAIALAVVIALLPAFGATPALSVDLETAIEAEAQEVERLADAIEHADVENSEEIAEELRSLANELREARSLERALLSLAESEKRLEAKMDPQFLSQKAAVQGLARDLALRPLVSDTSLDAATQLDELAEHLDELSEPEMRALADRLADLAASQTAGNPSLSHQLASAASSLSQGDLSGARQSLTQAASDQESGIASARGQQALSETQRALSAIESRLQGQGQGQAQGQGQGQGQGQAQGQGQGQGQGPGQGQGGGQGQAGDGASGVISGVRPGDGNAAGRGGQGAVGSGDAAGAGSEAQTSDIYDPIDTGSLSELLKVDIEGGAGDGDIVGRAEAPTQRGQSIVPYAQVLPEYLNEAADALTTLNLPPAMRGIVQSYFDQLAREAR